MDCRQARARWHLLLDDGGTDAALQQHLATCTPCGDYARQMSRLVTVLAELRDDTESAGSSRDAAVTHPPLRWNMPKRWHRLARPLRAAAVVGLLLAGGVFVGERALRTRSVPPSVGNSVDSIAEIDVAEFAVELHGESAAKYMAVSRPSSDAGVRMIWLYPTSPAGSSDEPS